MKGTVKWYNGVKGMGFIADEAGKEYFLHWKNLNMTGFKCVFEGDKVEFDVEEKEDGPWAVNVTMAK